MREMGTAIDNPFLPICIYCKGLWGHDPLIRETGSEEFRVPDPNIP